MPAEKKPKIIAVVGPTSSGKTSLAVKLAKTFDGEIVSADSRQVYKGMDIGTGKDLDEYVFAKAQNGKNAEEIPYHLIDVCEPTEQFSLAEFQKQAYQAIDDIIDRGKLPILAGGTGLYAQAIIDGYDLTDVKPDEKLRKKLEKKSLEKLQKMIKKQNIGLNNSDFNNKRRLIRIIEKNKNLKLKTKNSPKYDCLTLGLSFPKKELDKRIDNRLKYRIEKQGMIEEVKRLIRQGVSYERLDDFGLEYKYVAKHLKGELTLDEMTKKLAIASHQFAKRQMTWFKRDKKINWIKNFNEAQKLTKSFLK